MQFIVKRLLVTILSAGIFVIVASSASTDHAPIPAASASADVTAATKK